MVGIHDADFVRAVAKRFGLHPLLVEDILDSGRRPVLEDYEELVFLLMRLLDYDADHRRILAEQVCLVSGQDFVLTFQERETNLWDTVATRLAKGGGKLLRRGQEHLTHALVTAILDDYILTLGRLAEDVEELEQDILAGASGETLLEVYRYKREVLFLHRSLWPLREVSAGSPRMRPTATIRPRPCFGATSNRTSTRCSMPWRPCGRCFRKWSAWP